jgi:hypothetical protein
MKPEEKGSTLQDASLLEEETYRSARFAVLLSKLKDMLQLLRTRQNFRGKQRRVIAERVIRMQRHPQLR